MAAVVSARHLDPDGAATSIRTGPRSLAVAGGEGLADRSGDQAPISRQR